jgi:hypothetical protein
VQKQAKRLLDDVSSQMHPDKRVVLHRLKSLHCLASPT